PTLFGGGSWTVGPESYGRSHDARHFERVRKLVGGLEQRHLVLLHVAVVGHRQTLHGDHQRGEAADYAPAFTADEFERVGVFLLSHQARAASHAIAQLNPPELLARVEDPIFGQAAEVQHGGGGGIEEIQGEVAVARDVHAVGGDALETEVAGDDLAVERE